MRGMGDTAAYLRRGIREIICLALFYFTYLAGEYLFDVRVAEFVPPSEVVVYELHRRRERNRLSCASPSVLPPSPCDRYDKRHHGRVAGIGVAAVDDGGSI